MKEKIEIILDEARYNGLPTHIVAEQLLDLFSVSHSTTPTYLDHKYEVKWLINNTYQVEQNGACVYQGSESDCNEWLKCQLGYCG